MNNKLKLTSYDELKRKKEFLINHYVTCLLLGQQAIYENCVYKVINDELVIIDFIDEILCNNKIIIPDVFSNLQLTNHGLDKLRYSLYIAEENVEIYGNGLLSLPNDLFLNKIKLTYAEFANCKEVGNKTFNHCSTLKSVYMPNVEKIGNNTFDGCKLLEQINLPNVKYLGDGCFFNTKSLSFVKLDKLSKVSYFCFTGSSICEFESKSCITVDGYAFSDCLYLKKVNLPSCITIKKYAFKGTRLLESCYIPKVRTIQEYSFEKSGVSYLDIHIEDRKE